jgi:hypothetical protein
MKFGMGILLNMGKVHSWVATKFPDPWGQGGLDCLCSLNRLTWSEEKTRKADRFIKILYFSKKVFETEIIKKSN